MKQFAWLATKQARMALIYLLCIALALLFEYGKLHLIYGITFSFSSIFLLVAVCLFGVRWGLIASVLVQVCSIFVFHNPMFGWIYCLEILLIGLVNRRKPGQMLMWDAIYWFALGLPVMYGIYSGYFSSVSHELILMLVLALCNGLFNALMAEIALNYIPFSQWIDPSRKKDRTYSYSKVLFHLSIVAVAVPSLMYIVMNSRYSDRVATENSYQFAVNAASRIQQELSVWGKEDVLGIKLRSKLQIGYLQQIVQKYTSETLTNIVITDNEGRVLASNGKETILSGKYDWRSGKNVLALQKDFYQALPSSNHLVLPAQQWKEGSYIYNSSLPGLPLKLYIEIEVRHHQANVFAQFMNQLWYLLLFAAAAAAVAHFLSRMLVQGISKLASSTTDLPQKLKEMKAIEWPSSRVLEITSLSYNFRQMSLNLMQMFHEWKTMNEQLEEQTYKLRKSEEKLHQLAFYDILSGLPNRVYFTTHLQELIMDSTVSNRSIAVMFADLNRFKQINDTLGHDVGDLLLKEISERFASSLTEGCKLFRIGGDEFVILMEDADEVRACEVIERIFASLVEPIRLLNSSLYSSVSIGISMFPRDGDSMDVIVKNADIAMYFAKARGGNSFHFYEKKLNDMFEEEMLLDHGLREALLKDQLVLHYQPKVNTFTGAICGVEALVRWEHPELGRIPPDKFIPLAESSGLILKIDEWVLLEACRQNKAWQDAGLPKIPIAVNLSGLHFSQTHLVELIQQVLEQSGLDEKYLNLEITEGVFIKNVDPVIDTITRIRDMGIQLSIDDFGTGYSSLSQLQRLPISNVKLDRSFIHDIADEPKKAAVVKAIIDLAHSMRMTVVAEGVETKNEMNYLKQCKCDELQGYYFSRPLPADEFSALLDSEDDWKKPAARTV
ncbi:EAL domain-containing protein [Paenibacillus lutrae]